jgi:hypothetical protein
MIMGMLPGPPTETDAHRGMITGMMPNECGKLLLRELVKKLGTTESVGMEIEKQTRFIFHRRQVTGTLKILETHEAVHARHRRAATAPVQLAARPLGVMTKVALSYANTKMLLQRQRVDDPVHAWTPFGARSPLMVTLEVEHPGVATEASSADTNTKLALLANMKEELLFPTILVWSTRDNFLLRHLGAPTTACRSRRWTTSAAATTLLQGEASCAPRT